MIDFLWINKITPLFICCDNYQWLRLLFKDSLSKSYAGVELSHWKFSEFSIAQDCKKRRKSNYSVTVLKANFGIVPLLLPFELPSLSSYRSYPSHRREKKRKGKWRRVQDRHAEGSDRIVREGINSPGQRLAVDHSQREREYDTIYLQHCYPDLIQAKLWQLNLLVKPVRSVYVVHRISNRAKTSNLKIN